MMLMRHESHDAIRKYYAHLRAQGVAELIYRF